MEQKAIFDEARDAAYNYADQALQRNVFPTPEAIENLAHFDQPLPEDPGDAHEILKPAQCIRITRHRGPNRWALLRPG